MSLRRRLTLVIVGATALFLTLFIRQEMGEFKKRYRQATEEPLSDMAVLLAGLLSERGDSLDWQSDTLLAKAFNEALEHPLRAEIYDLEKEELDIRVYVVNREGRVIFDSRDPGAVDADYSRWNDVINALQGRYGARSTREDSDKSVLYVAAPIYNEGKVIGSLSVGKSVRTLDRFIFSAQQTTIFFGVLYGLGLIVLISLLTLWITVPLQRLTDYARAISQGKKANLPKVPGGEINQMAQAFEQMKRTLEGKAYVEHYIQTLTHEIKSPLSGIQGALEILEGDENLSRENQIKFLGHINHESARLKEIAQNLLKLAALETTGALQRKEETEIIPLLESILLRFSAKAEQKNISLEFNEKESLRLVIDTKLFSEAVANIVQNAIDFSPAEGKVFLAVKRKGNSAVITITDQGPGVPEWALEKIWDKFFSLPRPGEQRKSSGLGLALTKEIVKLHGGTVKLHNLIPAGTQATITLPL